MARVERRVAVFGGGIGGLTVAHELAERGFRVSVYERRPGFGGKARSHTGKGCEGSPGLPGEHGHRIFPGFYLHTDDTMKRIPFGDNPNGVLDNLAQVSDAILAQEDWPRLVRQTKFKRWPSAWSLWRDSGLTLFELLFYAARLLRILTACQERQISQYESLSWSDFLGSAKRSARFQKIFLRSWSQTYASLPEDRASTRTMGNIAVLMSEMFTPRRLCGIRVLNGPTSAKWIRPWIRHLESLGVDFHPESPLVGLQLAGGTLTGALVRHGAATVEVSADDYVCAMPVERMKNLVTSELAEAAPSLARLSRLETAVMGGFQLYLRQDLPMTHGHYLYADSAWALTSISQRQFWPDAPSPSAAQAAPGGIISVSIGDWSRPGKFTTNKSAGECTARELRDEIVAQIEHSLPPPQAQAFIQADVFDYQMEPGLEDLAERRQHEEPLMLNTVSSWQNRPEASTEIPNLFLAADYVRTHMDLATMEAANEAGRRAANAIMDAASVDAVRCQIWPPWDPWFLRILRSLDRQFFRSGKSEVDVMGAGRPVAAGENQ